MNKRQRKKREKCMRKVVDAIYESLWGDIEDAAIRASVDQIVYGMTPMFQVEADGRMTFIPQVDWMRQPITTRNFYNPDHCNVVSYSTVQDPTRWETDSGVIDFVSPSQDRSNYQYLTSRGFGRLFDGDQSRRDSFPSPYLPDGKENPAYAKIVTPVGGNFYGARLEEAFGGT